LAVFESCLFFHAFGVQGEYRVVGPAEIRKEMDRSVSEVASVLDIPGECARTLLIHFRFVTCVGRLSRFPGVHRHVPACLPRLSRQMEQGATV
jgi:hypothetical protein